MRERYATLPDAPDPWSGEQISKWIGKLSLRQPAPPGRGARRRVRRRRRAGVGPGVGRRRRLRVPVGRLAGAGGRRRAARHRTTSSTARSSATRACTAGASPAHHWLMSDYATGRQLNPIEQLLFSAAARDDAARRGGSSASAPATSRPSGSCPARWPARRAVNLRHAVARVIRRGEVTVARRALADDRGRARGRAEAAAVFVARQPGLDAPTGRRSSRAAGEHGRAIALDMPGFGERRQARRLRLHRRGLRPPSRRRARRARRPARPPGRCTTSAGRGASSGRRTTPTRSRASTLVNTGVLLDYRWHSFARIWRTRGVGELFFRTTNAPGLRHARCSAASRGRSRTSTWTACTAAMKDPGDPARGAAPVPRVAARAHGRAAGAAARARPAGARRLGRARPVHPRRAGRAPARDVPAGARSCASRTPATGRCSTRPSSSSRRSRRSSPSSSRASARSAELERLGHEPVAPRRDDEAVLARRRVVLRRPRRRVAAVGVDAPDEVEPQVVVLVAPLRRRRGARWSRTAVSSGRSKPARRALPARTRRAARARPSARAARRPSRARRPAPNSARRVGA